MSQKFTLIKSEEKAFLLLYLPSFAKERNSSWYLWWLLEPEEMPDSGKEQVINDTESDKECGRIMSSLLANEGWEELRCAISEIGRAKSEIW